MTLIETLREKKLSRFLPLFSLLVMAGAIAWIAHILAALSLHDILASVEKLSAGSIALALLLTAGSHATLGASDYLAVRYAGRSLSYPRAGIASFVAIAIGHTVGLAPFSSGAVRYRFYAHWGLRNHEIALVILFCAMTIGIGELAVTALVLLTQPESAERALAMDTSWLRALGALCALLLLAYLALCATRRQMRFWRWTLALPSGRLALAQLAVGLVNYALVIGVLQVCLAAEIPIDYPTACVAFILANLAALISTVPGGLGIIEAVILALVPGAQAAAGVLAFRLCYFLVPFALALAAFAVAELGFRARGRAGSRRTLLSGAR